MTKNIKSLHITLEMPVLYNSNNEIGNTVEMRDSENGLAFIATTEIKNVFQ